MDAVLFELLGSSAGHRMGDDESSASRQTRAGDLDDLAAIDLADDALQDHLLRHVGVLHERRILLQQVGELVGAESDAALVRHVAVAQTLHAVQEAGIGVGLVNGGGGIVAGVLRGVRQSLEDVGVELGHPHFGQLAGQGPTGVGDHLGLDLVARVDDERKGAVLIHSQGLDVAGQIGGSTVTLHAVAGVVHHGDHRDGINFDGLVALELVVVVQSEHGLGLTGETLVNHVGILGCEVDTTGDCHSNHTP